MINEIVFNIAESFDGGYEARTIGRSIYTQCDKFNDLTETPNDAVKCHFDEENLPSLIRINFVKDEVIAL